ncbi:matrix remodeling-associated protein 8 [Rana temporaria]|uniref:matrix remodeling-associated protein 8 n=1 Tax=Rana temporaria TaxID=8407 RepID=UPI001AAE012D|nr:matrix remodeling-associated protein 8 [Rana temporaria]XP_040181802.1 matrix remodeling-associated protein 8 [Rana temporaria]
MGMMQKILLCQLIILHSQLVYLYSVPASQQNPESVVVSVNNISAHTGSQALLLCQSYRMVWTQDNLLDRQRVLHWDLISSQGFYRGERLLDMFSAGEQRLYGGYNQGRILVSPNAFRDGNFSLVIKGVSVNDQGLYSCNLHHHYCHLDETVRVQLNTTKSERKVKMYWDGEKVVILALIGTDVVLPCENWNHMWTDRHREADQQVVHWDRQAPGIPHDRADRLIDMYASGEQRSYGPLFIRRKMNITDEAFANGDFSLHISNLTRGDEGTYSCHLHHHYCGLHERRIFHLKIDDPPREPPKELPKEPPREPPKVEEPEKTIKETAAAPAKDSTIIRENKVINVIIPENRLHFFQQLGYILATLLLFLLLLTAVILITRKHCRKGYGYHMAKPQPKEVNMKEICLRPPDLIQYKKEDLHIDYKNNILKERAAMDRPFTPKNIDLDLELRKEYCK